MSNSFQQYSNATLVIDGSIQLEAMSVKVQSTSNTQSVSTIAKGLAGPSLGAASSKWDISSATPTAGFEFDPNKDMKKGAIHEIILFTAGKKYTCNGWVDDWSFSKAHDNPSSLDFTLTCDAGDWELI